jgi:hypothetical protein
MCRAIAAAAAMLLTEPVSAQLFINELFFDPPGSIADASHEYVELRGPARMSLANHYLIFIENEDNPQHLGAAGTVEMVFDLGVSSLGTNGFFTIRQKVDPFSVYGSYAVDPHSTNLQNTGAGGGFGSGASSTVGATNLNNAGAPDGRMENSGFTAMLIRNDADPATNKPAIGLDLDAGNNGLDVPTGRDGWAILDAIGVFSEFGEAWDPDFNVPLGRTYAAINFGPENTTNTPGFIPNIEPGASYVGLDYEIEILARWGNSAGQTEADWHVSNVTDNSLSGFTIGGSDFRQSVSDPHPTGPIESNRSVPYGTPLTTTVGSPNYPLNVAPPIPGDFDGDGDVDGDDLTDEWKARFGDDLDGEDFLVWQRNVGTGLPAAGSAAPAAGAVPEPSTALLISAASTAFLLRSRRRIRGAR